MKKKVKIAGLIVILVLLMFICNFILNTNKITYKIKFNKNSFTITESNEFDFYKIEIKSKSNTFNFNIYNIGKSKKVVNDLYYYENTKYKCLLPIINNKVEVDMVCYKNDLVYNYHDIIGMDKELDEFVNTIEPYDKNKFLDNDQKTKKINSIKYYKDNNIDKNIAITTYKGLIINDKVINLFDKDVYNNKISIFIDKYYVIANYDSSYEFNYFYVINLDNGEINKIKSKDEISFDSYIQGIVDNKIYLYDIDNENQYEIDINNSKIKLVSNETTIKYYKNKKWEKISKGKANNEIYFDYSTLDNDFSGYDKVISSDYYYYLYKYNGKNYDIYKVNIDNLNVKKYIFTIPDLNINLSDNYLYFVNDDRLYYYSDETGLKSILENSEFRFNDTIKYYIY